MGSQLNLNTIFWFKHVSNIIHPFYIRNGMSLTIPNGKCIKDEQEARNTTMIVDIEGNIDFVPFINVYKLYDGVYDGVLINEHFEYIVWNEKIDIGHLFISGKIELNVMNDMKAYFKSRIKHWMIDEGEIMIPLLKNPN